MYNKVIMLGRITQDLELKTTPSGVSVLSFSIAVDRRFQTKGEEKKADFPRLTAWGKKGETIAKFLCKGRQIGVKGHISTGSYLKNGVTVYTTDVIVDDFEFLDHGEKHSYPAAANKIEEPADFEQINEDVPF